MLNVKKLGPAEVLFVVSCVFGVFLFGVVVGHYQLFPFSAIQFAWSALGDVIEERDMLLRRRPSEFLHPTRYPGNGVTRNLGGRVEPGLTLMYGFFDGGNEIRLIRADGSVVNRWPVKYYELFPEPDFVRPAASVPQSDWNAEIHGAFPLPDGSVVFNFNYLGTVKLDRCGRTQWTIPQMTHHAVSRASDGTFLIPSSRYVEGNSPYPNLRPPYVEDTILRVSETGEVLAEISVLDLLYKNRYHGALFGRRSGDLTHVNDVEELAPELAARFPMLAPGDLMLSMRMGSKVLVADPKTLKMKWYQAGPWYGQHDPDFLNSGTILVYNNDDTDGTEPRGSIIEVDPATRDVTYRYGAAPGKPFFAPSSGKHQELPGGHILVTEAKAGRAFEIDGNGEIVWEFVNRYDDRHAALISEATRYPADYFTVRDWSCQ